MGIRGEGKPLEKQSTKRLGPGGTDLLIESPGQFFETKGSGGPFHCDAGPMIPPKVPSPDERRGHSGGSGWLRQVVVDDELGTLVDVRILGGADANQRVGG